MFIVIKYKLQEKIKYTNADLLYICDIVTSYMTKNTYEY